MERRGRKASLGDPMAFPDISIVGGESLLGRELREALADAKVPAKVKLIGVDDSAATLAEQDGEPVVITPLDEDNLLNARFALLAGSPASSRKALALAAAAKTPPVIIDLTYALEDEPSARLRAPAVEPPGYEAAPGALHVVAHPASIALALFLSRLRASQTIRRSTVHVYEPASERGRRGIDELEKQTTCLLSFQSLPKNVFDAQLGFNMLSSYGSEAPEPLAAVELRIERHLASLLAACGGIPMPSLRLVQAPVFHGYSISAHVEFGEKPSPASIAPALESALVDVRGGDLEPPTNVGFAGQSGIAIGSIAADRNNPMACWFWIVADNLRLMADNAVAVLRPLLQGKVSGAAG